MAKKTELATKKDEKGPEIEKEKPWKKMTLKEKYNYVRNHITIEPVVACYIMPSVFASLATQNLNLEKACRVNLAYSKEVCDALSNRETANYTKEEEAVQQLVASMAVWKTILQSGLPAFLIMFVGAWSDRWGQRKPCILLPIVGEFFTVIGLMLCTYFFYELPMEVAGFVEGLFPALTGGWFTMFMGVFSYIGDVTTVEMRTLRIGIVNVFCSLGVPVGLACSGVVYKKVGFYGTFAISGTMYIFAIIYGYYKIQEPKKVDVPVLSNKKCAFLRDFFDINHISETFRVAFKEGENKRKTKVMLLMLVVMVVIGPIHGEMVVMYLFTRLQFNWDEVDFSLFSTYNMVTSLIGTSISVGIFSHLLKIDDAIVGIYSCMSKILSSIVYGLAKTSWVFYLGAIVEILNGTSFIAMRSIASKLVPTEELGKVNSLFGMCEALMPLVYGPMYSATYAATINIMPGAFFLLGGFLTAPAVAIFSWMYIQHRKELKASKKKTGVENPNDSLFKDVILNAGPKETQLSSPIVNGYNRTGMENAAFEMDKTEA